METKRDTAQWRVKVVREAFAGDVDEFRALHGKAEGERLFFERNRPVDRAEAEGNLLTTAGATALWQGLTGTLGTAFNNANAAIGVGDGTTAAAAGDTNLSAVSNAYRQAMDATFPTISTSTITFKVTVGTGNANFHWQEWGVFSGVGTGSPPSGGTMLNHKVTDLGTKTSAASWAFTVTITLS